MHSICVWNMVKQSKSLQTKYDATYVYDRYHIRTHVYVFLFSVKKRDSGHSIYLALSHFICKTAALRTAAQSITSKNLYKMLAKGFLFVLFHPNNFPLAIGLYAN